MQGKLAMYGGKPVRTKSFPPRTPFGEEEIREVTEAINPTSTLKSQNWGFFE